MAQAHALSFDQTQYKEKSRKLISLVNQLRDAGAQFSLDLPCMVVCGNQSAGKSSLLERLCGVRLPRAAGTCTKCPTEVRLSTRPPGAVGVTWHCQIKLRREYSKDNQQLDPKPKEEAFKTLTQEHKDQLHLYISAAQRALLNPDTPADIFVQHADTAAAAAAAAAGRSNSRKGGQSPAADTARGSSPAAAAAAASGSCGAAADTLKFTRNVVVLEITGADVDLALIDLPGIIQTEQGDDGANVELVQQLVRQYISSDRAIIVATITCKDDIDNQGIVQMARSVDKDGHRTIGVLTKADTIEPGTHHTWLPVLQGITYPLRLGYFCVVNPSQEDLNNNISEADAAAKEADFFQHDLFFSSEQVAAIRDRFGVDALRVQLSKQLVALTQRELPKMKHAVEEALALIEQQLRKLPPPPSSDASLELFRRLRDLSGAVKRAVDGVDNVAFFRAADACYRELRKAVLTARPTVRLTAVSGAGAQPSAGAAAGPSHRNSKTLGEEDAEFWLGPAEAVQTEEGQEEPEGLITMEGVRELAAKYRVTELPTFSPYRVLEVLVQGLKGKWDAAAMRCLHAVGDELQGLTDRLVEEHFGQFAAARAHIRSLLYELHAKLLEDTQQRVQELMDMEKENTWTQNDHYLSDSKQRFLSMLAKQLSGSGSGTASQNSSAIVASGDGSSSNESMNMALKYLAAAGYGLTAEDIDLAVSRKRRKLEHDQGLLELIAGTLAYFKVSSKRVIDGVPMHLRHFLLLRFCKELDELPVQLAATIPPTGAPAAAAAAAAGAGKGSGVSKGSSSAAGDATGSGVHNGVGQAVGGLQQQPISAAELMAEDESTAERRAQLKRQLTQLQDVRRILNVF